MFAIIDAEESGYGATEVIVLLAAAVVLAAAFVAWERRAAQPLLDLRFFRLPQFTVPNFVAFCTYLATFAIFFFTALYLVEVLSDSGYKIALVFAPMTVLMIIGRCSPATGPGGQARAGRSPSAARRSRPAC